MVEHRWKGFIKDYNGSTMMQCKIERDIKNETFYEDIRRHAVVSPLPVFIDSGDL